MKTIALRVFVPIVALLVVQASFAQTLKVTQFAGSTTQGGVNIQAQYDQGATPWCPDANVRWIQRIKLTKGDHTTQKDDVPGYPSGDFIDPQPTQPGGPWDNDPWYDVTYNSAADRTADTNRQGGKGKFFNDSPGGWGPFGPMYFDAWTAVVCIDTTTKKAAFMGGFTWGFCVSATGGITAIAPAALGNNAATAGIFNGALGSGPAGFKAWSVTTGDPQCQLTFSTVPEPSSFLVLAGAGLVLVSRRRRAA